MYKAPIKPIPAIIGAAKWLYWANPPVAIAVGVVVVGLVGYVAINETSKVKAKVSKK